jgi:hypothetical protein
VPSAATRRRKRGEPAFGTVVAPRGYLAARQDGTGAHKSRGALAAADIEGQDQIRHGAGDGTDEPGGDMFGPGDRRTDDDRIGAGKHGRCREAGAVVAPFGEDGDRSERRTAAHERKIRHRRHRARTGISRERRAEDVGAGIDGAARLVDAGDVGHGQRAGVVDRGHHRGHRDRACPARRVEGDDARASPRQRHGIVEERRDPDGGGVEIALDQADHRQRAGRGDRRHVGDAFDAQAARAAVARGTRETDHEIGGVGRTARHGLA